MFSLSFIIVAFVLGMIFIKLILSISSEQSASRRDRYNQIHSTTPGLMPSDPQNALNDPTHPHHATHSHSHVTSSSDTGAHGSLTQPHEQHHTSHSDASASSSSSSFGTDSSSSSSTDSGTSSSSDSGSSSSSTSD